jgi:hypothetical protein
LDDPLRHAAVGRGRAVANNSDGAAVHAARNQHADFSRAEIDHANHFTAFPHTHSFPTTCSSHFQRLAQVVPIGSGVRRTTPAFRPQRHPRETRRDPRGTAGLRSVPCPSGGRPWVAAANPRHQTPKKHGGSCAGFLSPARTHRGEPTWS